MNPFSLPGNDPDLYLQREENRAVERAETMRQRLIPVHQRQYSRPQNMLEELRVNSSFTNVSFNRTRRSHSCNRENIHELILRKREILLTKKKIEHKKNSIYLLDTLSRSREEEHKKNAKNLEDNLVRVEKYEESLKAEAKRRAELADKKAKERAEKQVEIHILEQQTESLYGKKDRKTEELRQLSVYKNFVEELYKSSDTAKSTTFVTENIEDLYTTTNLLKNINSLEQKNLFLIQLDQEAEQNLENLKSKAQHEISSLKVKHDGMVAEIKQIERQKEFLNSKISAIINEKVEKPLISEETMKLIHESLVDIFRTIIGESSNYPSDFEMLEELENLIRFEIEKTKTLDEDVLRQREKEIDKDRRVENVEALRAKEIEKAKEFSKKIERRKEKYKKKVGRPNMGRTKIPEKAVVEKKIEIPQEILDRREFLEEYIPFP